MFTLGDIGYGLLIILIIALIFIIACCIWNFFIAVSFKYATAKDYFAFTAMGIGGEMSVYDYMTGYAIGMPILSILIVICALYLGSA